MKDTNKKSNMPAYMFIVTMLFITWMAYKAIAFKMLEAGIPSFIIWPSFIISVVICGFAIRPMFMMMFTGLEESIKEFFDR